MAGKKTGGKFYNLYCEICNWKRVTDGSNVDDLFELKTSSIPGGPPKWDHEKKKAIPRPDQEQRRKFRCPGCGRVVMAKEISNPQEKVDQYWETQKQKEDAIRWESDDAKYKEQYDEERRKYEEERRRFDTD